MTCITVVLSLSVLATRTFFQPDEYFRASRRVHYNLVFGLR